MRRNLITSTLAFIISASALANSTFFSIPFDRNSGSLSCYSSNGKYQHINDRDMLTIFENPNRPGSALMMVLIYKKEGEEGFNRIVLNPANASDVDDRQGSQALNYKWQKGDETITIKLNKAPNPSQENQIWWEAIIANVKYGELKTGSYTSPCTGGQQFYRLPITTAN